MVRNSESSCDGHLPLDFEFHFVFTALVLELVLALLSDLGGRGRGQDWAGSIRVSVRTTLNLAHFIIRFSQQLAVNACIAVIWVHGELV